MANTESFALECLVSKKKPEKVNLKGKEHSENQDDSLRSSGPHFLSGLISGCLSEIEEQMLRNEASTSPSSKRNLKSDSASNNGASGDTDHSKATKINSKNENEAGTELQLNIENVRGSQNAQNNSKRDGETEDKTNPSKRLQNPMGTPRRQVILTRELESLRKRKRS